MTGGEAVGWDGCLVLQGDGSRGHPSCVRTARESRASAEGCSIYFAFKEKKKEKKKITWET